MPGLRDLINLPLLAACSSLPLSAQVPFVRVVVESACSSPAKPYGKAISDIDGDGQPDLFISSDQGEGMHWYRYPDWQKHTIRPGGSWSEDCRLSDIDGDGDQDVVYGHKKGLYWYENPGPARTTIVLIYCCGETG